MKTISVPGKAARIKIKMIKTPEPPEIKTPEPTVNTEAKFVLNGVRPSEVEAVLTPYGDGGNADLFIGVPGNIEDTVTMTVSVILNNQYYNINMSIEYYQEIPQ